MPSLQRGIGLGPPDHRYTEGDASWAEARLLTRNLDLIGEVGLSSEDGIAGHGRDWQSVSKIAKVSKMSSLQGTLWLQMHSQRVIRLATGYPKVRVHSAKGTIKNNMLSLSRSLPGHKVICSEASVDELQLERMTEVNEVIVRVDKAIQVCPPAFISF